MSRCFTVSRHSHTHTRAFQPFRGLDSNPSLVRLTYTNLLRFAFRKRNLALQEQGPEISSEMFNKKILNSLLPLIKRLTSSISIATDLDPASASSQPNGSTTTSASKAGKKKGGRKVVGGMQEEEVEMENGDVNGMSKVDESGDGEGGMGMTGVERSRDEEERDEKRERLIWDVVENVGVLVWCLA